MRVLEEEEQGGTYGDKTPEVDSNNALDPSDFGRTAGL
jgi:hypothetical protein